MAADSVTPEQIGKYYDEWTERYRVSFGDTFQACRPTESADLHRYILERCGLRDGDRMLDAGCGICGPSMYFAAHRQVSIDAVTISSHQVATAVRLVESAALQSKIAVHLMDFNRVDEHFPPATFDLIVFLESLSHAADPAVPLASAFKILKPGGSVYVKDFFRKVCETEEEAQRVQEVIDRVDRAFVLKTPTLRRTIDALTRIGFRELEAAPIRFTNDNAVWSRFNTAHDFDLFGGKAPCEWSNWLELSFRKPLA